MGEKDLKRSYDLYLQDILEAIIRIEEYTEKMEFSDFDGSKITKDAVLRNLEMIGEAASQLPFEVTAKYTSIPWRDIKGFRIVAAHHYWNINLERIWDIIEHKLSDLKKEIKYIIEQEALP